MSPKMIIKCIVCILAFTWTFQAKAQDAPINKESFDNINLSYPGLEKVDKLVADQKYDEAGKELLKYYRNRRNVRHLDFNIDDKEKYAGKKLPQDVMEMADNALIYKFKPHKSYSYLDYGKDINWQYQSVPDELLRTFFQRTNWWQQMGLAYWSTGDEKYAKEWVFQVRDWVKKNQQGAYPDDKLFA